MLKKGALEGRRYLNSSGSTAVRIYDRNIDDIPVTVELYGPYAKIVDYSADGLSPEDEETVIDLVNRMVYVERARIIYQKRHKREGLEQHTRQSEDSLELTVKEGGLSFLVDLVSHIDTGLFLDQALTRDMVRTLSFGLRVLNQAELKASRVWTFQIHTVPLQDAIFRQTAFLTRTSTAS